VGADLALDHERPPVLEEVLDGVRAAGLSANLEAERDEALLYRTLATLREDVPLRESLEDLEWRGGHRAELGAMLSDLGEPGALDRLTRSL